MARTVVWIVPGFGGSELLSLTFGPGGTHSQTLVWLFLNTGTLDAIQRLRIPEIPEGSVIVPRETLELFGYGYGNLIRSLRQALPADWYVRPDPYDFRRSIQDLGAELAARIVVAGEQPGGHRIVAHSQGAMVAISAYRHLVEQGKQGWVWQLITMGGIIQGTYSGARTFCEMEDTPGLIAAVGTTFSPRPFAEDDYYRETYLTVGSWPAVYQMLPDPLLADDGADEHRAAVYDPATFQNTWVPIQNGLLTAARDQWWPWYRAALAMVPASVAISICGTGERTPWRITGPELAGMAPVEARLRINRLSRARYLPTWSETLSGDNRVTLAQQSIPGSDRIFVSGAHAELQDHPRVLERLPQLLAEGVPPVFPSPPPPDPPPEPLFLLDPIHPQRTGPHRPPLDVTLPDP